MMISYAQNAEDVLLRRVFGDRAGGFYLDVGANDPVRNSVTKHFYDCGWSGINVEPEIGCWDRLRADRPRDVNLNVGVSDRAGTLTFYDAEATGGWSTFAPEQAAGMRARGWKVVERPVAVTTLARICEEHVGDRTVDFLKIDVELHERAVIAGADWARWRPRVVLVEANGVDLWEPLLHGADYLDAASDGVNRYYVRREDRDLLPRFAAATTDGRGDFVAYDALDRYLELRARYPEIEGIGPNAMALAIRLRRLGGRFPAIASAARRLVRRAG